MLDAIIAIFAGAILVTGANLTHQQEGLCSAMGGKFTPTYDNGTSICVDGRWSNLVLARPR